MSLRQGIGNAEYLKKRIPKNAKYQHVKTRLDTGCSLTKYMERLEDIKKNYRYRKDEIFKRLKVTTFAQLIIQVASVSELNSSMSECESNPPEDVLSVVSEAELESLTVRSNGSLSSLSPSQSSERQDGGDSVHTARSTLLSVISGVGELTVDPVRPGSDPGLSPDPDRPDPDCPYLLLDVRDRDEYDRCHIITAHSFPISSLSRTMNPYSKEVLEYKNAAGKIIIVYDEDERIASQAATMMCERGFENLFMLSGGLKVVGQKFPGSLLTGPLPPHCVSPTGSVRTRRRTQPGLVQSQIQTQAETEAQWRFTPDQLNRLQDQLEEIHIPSNTNSRMSSRMSSVSSDSKGSHRQSSSSSSSSVRESSRAQSGRPWK